MICGVETQTYTVSICTKLITLQLQDLGTPGRNWSLVSVYVTRSRRGSMLNLLRWTDDPPTTMWWSPAYSLVASSISMPRCTDYLSSYRYRRDLKQDPPRFALRLQHTRYFVRKQWGACVAPSAHIILLVSGAFLTECQLHLSRVWIWCIRSSTYKSSHSIVTIQKRPPLGTVYILGLNDDHPNPFPTLDSLLGSCSTHGSRDPISLISALSRSIWWNLSTEYPQ